MILEHFMPGKRRANSAKIQLTSRFFSSSLSDDCVSVHLEDAKTGRVYTLTLSLDEAEVMAARLARGARLAATMGK